MPCSDRAIEWATKLSFELGLPSNNPVNLSIMRNKILMQKAIADAGLRYIKGKEVQSFDEAMAFFKAQTNDCIVVKPIQGCATIGVCICHDEAELKMRLNIICL